MNNIYKNYFKNKKVLIFGGTGSFGSAFLRRAVNLDFKEIKIFSRDEKTTRFKIKHSNKKIKF